jgi:hypothetical protein
MKSPSEYRWGLLNAYDKRELKEAISIEELLFTKDIVINGISLNADAKDALLDIIDQVVQAEWTFESVFQDIAKIADAISDFKKLL